MQTISVVRSISVAAFLTFFTPAVTWACPICFGLETGSDEAVSLNWAVFTLLGVTGGSRQALGNEDTFHSQAQHIRSKGRA